MNNTSLAIKQLQQEQRTHQVQNQPATIHSIVEQRSRYRKQFLDYDTLERASKPQNATKITSVIGEQSKKIVSVAAQKLRGKRKEFIVNSKYIEKVTGKKRRHNINLLNEINGTVFYIKFYKKYKHYHNCYVFTHLKNADSKVQNFAPSKSLQPLQQKEIPTPYKNNSTKSTRSNVRAHESNSCNNSNSVIPTKTTELVETESGLAKGESGYYQANTKTAELVETLDEAQAVETTSPIPATVTQLKTKSPRLANKRKTRTKDEQKQRKTSHVISNGFLAGGKRLREIQPYLTDEVCDKLRISSGRGFTNKAIREITKAIAASEKGAKAFFHHINGVIAYLTPALVNEKRDAVKTSGEHYYTLAGMTAEDKLWQKQEKYLASVEQDSITHVCPENQLRAKLANALKKNSAYLLLSSLRKLKLVGGTMQIHLKRILSLTEHEKAIILAQVQATYETVSCDVEYRSVEYLEFMVDEQMPIASNSNIQERQESEQLKLPEGVWGKIAQSFVVEYGQELYIHWISKLEFEQDEINKSITLKANSGMVKDRIEEQYIPFLTSVAQGLGITTIELI